MITSSVESIYIHAETVLLNLWKQGVNIMFCKHKWEILSETITKSAVEVCSDAGVTSIESLPNAAGRKLIQIVACNKCGKINRYVTNI